uniref:Vacuolar-sorting protein SNF7 n=1 Tax=Blastobotrys adeninivorans TaxID=409370 RepID=A0A060TE81_BLAAD
MWSWLVGGGSQKKELPMKAIVTLKTQIDMLDKKEKYLQSQVDAQTEIAKKNVTTNKAVARNALKRKKTYEAEIEKIQNQVASMETQLHALETANLNHETMKAMHEGARAMKQIHGNMNIDKVDATMDEIRDQVALGEEIRDAISRPLGQEVDEDELNEDLAELEQEALDAQMVGAGPAPSSKLPTHAEPAGKEEEEEEEDHEEELRKLQAEMAM